MSKTKGLSAEHNEMIGVCKYLRDENLKGFKALQSLKETGNLTDADLDYEIARDRKTALILKTIYLEVGVQKIASRQISN
jgi:hypothetical protein